MQYQLEYGLITSSIYEEPEFELNEILLVKKIIFLLIALVMQDGLKDYAEVRGLYKKFKDKKLQLPRNPMQTELLKLAMHLILMIDAPTERHAVSIPYVIDKLYEVERASKKPGFGTVQGGVRYPMQLSPEVAASSGKKKEKVSLVIGGARGKRVVSRPSKPDRSSNLISHAGGAHDYDDDGTTPFSEREEVFDSRMNDDDEEEESRDDFLCVPANNIDNDPP